MTAADELARALWRARTGGGVVPRAAADDIVSTAAAYALQRRVAAIAGLTRAGWKVGVTSEVAQTLFGVREPATGPMFAVDCHVSPADVPVFEAHSASVEGELAFRFATALPPRDRAYDRAEVLAAVGRPFWLTPTS